MIGQHDRGDQTDGDERSQQPPRPHARAVHHDDLGIGGELVQDVGHRDDKSDRRDDHDKLRNDQAGDAEEGQDGLALSRHQVDVAQRLGHPDGARQADEHQQERPERGAKNIPADRPHPPAPSHPSAIHLRRRTAKPGESPVRQTDPPQSNNLDGSTKWLRNGKPIEHEQQTVNGQGRRTARIGLSDRESRFRSWCRPGFADRPVRAITAAFALPSERNSTMADAAKLAFAPFATPAKGVLVLFCEEGLKFGAASRKALEPTGDLVQRAAAADRFTGKSGSSLDLLAPAGLGVGRLSILGVGKAAKLKAQDFVKLGGSAMGKVPASAGEATIFADLAGGAMKPDQAAELALGTQLRAYVFDRYKTKRKEGEEQPGKPAIRIAVEQRGGGAKGLGERARAGRRRRGDGARPHQRARQRALSGGVRPPRFAAEEGRRRHRGARRAGDEEARHERAARRRPRLAQGQPRGDHALERRQEGRRRRSPSSARA